MIETLTNSLSRGAARTREGGKGKRNKRVEEMELKRERERERVKWRRVA